MQLEHSPATRDTSKLLLAQKHARSRFSSSCFCFWPGQSMPASSRMLPTSSVTSPEVPPPPPPPASSPPAPPSPLSTAPSPPASPPPAGGVGVPPLPTGRLPPGLVLEGTGEKDGVGVEAGFGRGAVGMRPGIRGLMTVGVYVGRRLMMGALGRPPLLPAPPLPGLASMLGSISTGWATLGGVVGAAGVDEPKGMVFIWPMLLVLGPDVCGGTACLLTLLFVLLWASFLLLSSWTWVVPSMSHMTDSSTMGPQMLAHARGTSLGLSSSASPSTARATMDADSFLMMVVVKMCGESAGW